MGNKSRFGTPGNRIQPEAGGIADVGEIHPRTDWEGLAFQRFQRANRGCHKGCQFDFTTQSLPSGHSFCLIDLMTSLHLSGENRGVQIFQSVALLYNRNSQQAFGEIQIQVQIGKFSSTWALNIRVYVSVQCGERVF